MPAYTEPMSSRKFAKIPNTNGSAFGPTGSRREMRASGTTAPCNRVVLLEVARIPSVSQSSSVSTPASSRVRKPWTRVSSPSFPKTPSRVHAGARDVKIFVPVKA